jgi:uncharacterized lipoprotein YajG
MRPLMRLAPIACTLLIASCAKPPPSLSAAPQLSLAPEALRPCALHVLPSTPTLADLEIGYVTRGAQLVACDAARRLAVETHQAQQALGVAKGR